MPRSVASLDLLSYTTGLGGRRAGRAKAESAGRAGEAALPSVSARSPGERRAAHEESDFAKQRDAGKRTYGGKVSIAR